MFEQFSWYQIALVAGTVIIAGIVLRKITKSTANHAKPSARTVSLKAASPVPEPVVRDFTPEELAVFNGQNDSPVYLAVKGIVYDVSPGRAFYGPEGPYEAFAGHDCTRALAKSSLEQEDIRPEWEDLSWGEKDTLREWIDRFNIKYKVVGKVIQPSSPSS
mmetsp:Transcript_15847/g.26219  ORF Transcript_15847/g.26219 Transcript_15847/m.26219 type:complete len:161 (-) Transcript_15847:409-891(-)